MSKDQGGERSRRSFKPRLLLADEDFDDLRCYSKILSQLGYEVRSFASYGGAAACLALEAFDLIIVSQGSSNFERGRVLACAIEKDRRTPVLVLTRSIEMPCYLEAMQSGARDCVEKPLPPSRNWQAREQICANSTGRSLRLYAQVVPF